MKISGRFEVTLTPAKSSFSQQQSNQMARMTLDKQFTGELDATSKGEMLSCRTPSGGAGYVAMEQVTGILQGKYGTFVLQHYGMMEDSGQRLTLEVVPGSSNGQLEGLSGSMNIRIEEGQHYYDFDFQLEQED